MNDTSFLTRPGALTDIRVDDPQGRVIINHPPVMATPAVVSGVIIGVALVNAFVAGRDGGPLEPPIEIDVPA
ncbi:hypothetical protein AB0K86_29555 [Streptomyces clavifer]|uniref:hypothetical protein n=1 Tax=Streptomyces TaxID=1883 RepID=UPI0006F5C9AF|nr:MULTISPECIES: hypothetical protein [unclassified Streptomyces]KQX94586.1 hypothetical protein ASD26_19155 [Streptomyces sp. Root1319]KQZ05451.1 hypothetical protein ASD51_13735 [Streptomyces sp. Root55]RPK73391.1 hypothetical protein EES45_31050 [Streptomyces sp. ADI97-07]